MCGITGFIDKQVLYNASVVAKKMGDAIYARGPDSGGVWQDPTYGINLVHRRLAILDLTVAGHQPMVSHCGRFVLVFNGEIYNAVSLRKELDSHSGGMVWRGHSDTEVILQGFATWGMERTLQKSDGMFALAVWDRQTQNLYLARDRMGEKPLYYGYFTGVFGFASELKALKEHPKFKGEINRDALGQLMLHNCIPAPLSIYDNIYKLAPGHLLKLKYSQFCNHELPPSKAYWQLSEHLKTSYHGSFMDAVDDLDVLLTDVIKDQMIADVSLGCFLSGGVDSSTVAAIMQSQSSTRIKTFSIGFNQDEYNEAHFAKAVAKHLGTDHTELYVTEQDALSVIQILPQIYDEPFADSSQIPTYLVSKLAKTKVTVSLSGDGGDELFGGYTRYLATNKVRSIIGMIPEFVKPLISKLLLSNGGSAILGQISHLFLHKKISNLSEKMYKANSMLRSGELEGVYFALTANWQDLNKLCINVNQTQSLWWRSIFLPSDVEKMMYLDCLGYLPDDILVKVDRAAMANSLESRVPLLNHHIVEFASSLPLEYKIKPQQSKAILREVLYKYVPRKLIERPKRGFAIPIQEWLRGELKDWTCELLNPRRLQNQGFFNFDIIDKTLQEHLAGKANNAHLLWNVLMFQQWLEYGQNKIG